MKSHFYPFLTQSQTNEPTPWAKDIHVHVHALICLITATECTIFFFNLGIYSKVSQWNHRTQVYTKKSLKLLLQNVVLQSITLKSVTPGKWENKVSERFRINDMHFWPPINKIYVYISQQVNIKVYKTFNNLRDNKLYINLFTKCPFSSKPYAYHCCKSEMFLSMHKTPINQLNTNIFKFSKYLNLKLLLQKIKCQ